MTTVLTTMADALIDFILSLLRDPAAQEEFDADPEGTLAARGMQNVTHADVCSVLPVVYDHPQVVQRAASVQSDDPDDVVRELRTVMNSNSYITNNSTLVDQSVNQNIWAQGDVMQMFDNDTVLATGEGSTAAGGDIVHDSSQDSSTNITAGGDAVVDNDIDVSTVEGSYNEATDATTTDNSTTETYTDVTMVTPDDAIDDPAPADADSGMLVVDETSEAFEDDGY